MRKYIDILTEQARTVTQVIEVPGKISPETAERWMEKMHQEYGIEYRIRPDFITSLFGPDFSSGDTTFQVRGPETIIDNMQRALVRFKDENAEPDDIISKVYELTLVGELPIEDSIRHCTRKFNCSYDEIANYIFKHFEQLGAAFYLSDPRGANLIEQIKRLAAGQGYDLRA